MKGPLLGFHGRLQRVFENALAKGAAVQEGNERCVRWKLEGYERVGTSSKATAVLADRLRSRIDEVEDAVRELDGLLKGGRGSSGTIRVSVDLLRRLGGDSDDQFVMYSPAELRPFREILARGSAGVGRAIARGDFAQRGNDVKLYGWAFLPPHWEPASSSPEPACELHLELGERVEVDGVVVQHFHWSQVGPVGAIGIVSRGDSGDEIDHGLIREAGGVLESGIWSLPLEEIRSGDAFFARGTARGEVIESNVVSIPYAPAPDVAVVGPVSSTEPEEPTESVMQADPKPEADPEPDEDILHLSPEVVEYSDPPTQRSWWWLWWLLLLLILLFLLIFWLLLPLDRHREPWRTDPLVTDHLPVASEEHEEDDEPDEESPSVVRSEPPGVESHDDSSVEVTDSTTPERTPVEWEGREILVLRDDDSGDRVYVLDDRVFLIREGDQAPRLIGPAPRDATIPNSEETPFRRLPTAAWIDGDGDGKDDGPGSRTDSGTSNLAGGAEDSAGIDRDSTAPDPSSDPAPDPSSDPAPDPDPDPIPPGKNDEPEVPRLTVAEQIEQAEEAARDAESRKAWKEAEQAWLEVLRLDADSRDGVLGLERVRKAQQDSSDSGRIVDDSKRDSKERRR
ncbi:hypothetical protein OAR33_00190 [bacterium]|nr:hypothetical protein [bacterium]MDC0991972.1 hypothetical protein [bacterium]